MSGRKSRSKGQRGEREVRDLFIKHNYQAKRGYQSRGGGKEAADVELNIPLHVEVKFVEKLSLYSAVTQAETDAQGKDWVVAHRKTRKPWLFIVNEDLFFKMLVKYLEAK